MGSSKKQKDKDRHRDYRKRHHDKRHRSRSRSKSKERDRRELFGERYNYKDRERRDDGKRRRDDFENDNKSFKVKEEPHDELPPIKTTSSGGDISLSIEDTNKIRAKLGLKPLQTTDARSKENAEKSNDGDSLEKSDVHLPPENMAEKLQREKLKERLAIIREKRRINEKLGKVKSLAASDSEEDDVAAWVERSRKQQIEKEVAEKRAKVLEEMDAEFGISSLVEDAFGSLEKRRNEAYTSKHLQGLQVQHSKEMFIEGQGVILTLQDKGVLDENEDILINVNIVDNEKAARNVEVKKKKPAYNPYDEELDEYGMVKKTLLSKYDEEIQGQKKDSFKIGSQGIADTTWEREIREIQRRLQDQQETLSLKDLVPAREYYTTEELVPVIFKRPKKIRRVRKRERLKPEDLKPLPGENFGYDHGSRVRKIKIEPADEDEVVILQNGETDEAYDPENEQVEDMVIEEPEYDDTNILGPDEDLEGVALEEDEADLELQLALRKGRKAKQLEHFKRGSDRVMDEVKTNMKGEEKPFEGKGASIVLNSTSEFCRTLGDIPTYGLSGNRDEDQDELMDFERELMEERRREEQEQQAKGVWNEVDIDDKPVEIKDEDVTILEEEPVVNHGLAGALKLAVKKGYLEDEVKKSVSAPKHSYLHASSYTIEDKNLHDIDDKYSRRDRYTSGPLMDFKDKDCYKPDVKLEYVDDSGRILNAKEAFRHLSHKFHGKISGKIKTEKRMKKLEEEQLMKKMSSTDTPLNTLALLQEKQRQTQSPYIVLSGGNKSLTANTISKPK